MLSNGTVVPIRGVRLEASPTGPITPEGGGYNASTSADFITLASPLMPGQSVNIDFKTGVVTSGGFPFLHEHRSLKWHTTSNCYPHLTEGVGEMILLAFLEPIQVD